jgi:dTDP-4-dehydrorhamnose reductase
LTKLVYVSTDSVYNGNRSNHSEVEIPQPSNHYSLTKLDGEIRAKKLNPEAVIVRTNLYGFDSRNGTSLAEWAIQNFLRCTPIEGFTDVYFNPVYTKQLARLIHSVISLKFSGIMNIGSNLFLSKYDFLVQLCKQFGFSTELIKKKLMKRKRFAAQRPKNTTMNVNLLKSVVGKIPDFSDGLKEMKTNWNGG